MTFLPIDYSRQYIYCELSCVTDADLFRLSNAKGTHMNKLWPNSGAALEGVVRDGNTQAIGGFGPCGIPGALIAALRNHDVSDLIIASNNTGIDGAGVGILLEFHQVHTMIFLLRLLERGVRAAIPRWRS
jgi:hypothetical protein